LIVPGRLVYAKRSSLSCLRGIQLDKVEYGSRQQEKEANRIRRAPPTYQRRKCERDAYESTAWLDTYTVLLSPFASNGRTRARPYLLFGAYSLLIHHARCVSPNTRDVCFRYLKQGEFLFGLKREREAMPLPSADPQTRARSSATSFRSIITHSEMPAVYITYAYIYRNAYITGDSFSYRQTAPGRDKAALWFTL